MNVLDNEMVLEFAEGSIRFKNVPSNQERCWIRYTGLNPNGLLTAPTGSVAFGPAGSWENISLGGVGSLWEKIGTGLATPDGFLAPNEFYVDPTAGPGPTGREVTTINAAIALADTLFAPGVAIVIRLREGQNHTWSQSTIAPTRDITIWAEGQITGEGVDETVAGRVIYGGAGIKLDTTATRRRFQIRNLSVQGTLLVGPGWDVLCSEVTFTGSMVAINQGGGIGLDVSVTLDRCTDDGNVNTDVVSSFHMESTNHAPAEVNRTRVLIEGCQFHAVVTNFDKRPFLSLGNSRATVRNCSIYVKADFGAVGVFNAPAAGTILRFIDTSFVMDSPNDDGRLLSGSPTSPTTRFLGNCRISVINAIGLPNNDWTIGILTVAGPLVVELAKPPSQPFPGLVLSDENAWNPFVFSGIRGPITKRVMTRKGVAFTGGRKIYGSALATNPLNPGNTVTWWTPTTSPAVVPSSPTTKALPIPADQVVSIGIEAVARDIPFAGFSGAFRFRVIIQKIGGVATIVAIVGSTTFAGVHLVPGIDANNEFTIFVGLDAPPTNADVVVQATFLEV